MEPSAEKDATCVTGREGGCHSYRCGSDCTNEYDRMHPCPACAAEEWRDGRLVSPSMSETICVHFVGLTPGLWCGACNTHPEHPDLTRVTPLAWTEDDR